MIQIFAVRIKADLFVRAAQTSFSSDLHQLRPSSAQTVISSDIHQLPLQQCREEVLHVHNVSEGHLEWGLEPGLKHMIG